MSSSWRASVLVVDDEKAIRSTEARQEELIARILPDPRQSKWARAGNPNGSRPAPERSRPRLQGTRVTAKKEASRPSPRCGKRFT